MKGSKAKILIIVIQSFVPPFSFSVSICLPANPCPYADQYNNCPDLKQQWGCSNKDVASWCPASCKCTTQII